MKATLSLFSLTVAAGDVTPSNNPNLRYVDWKRQVQGIVVANASSKGYEIPPSTEAIIFDGTRSIGVDVTTNLALTVSVLSPDRYRITYTSGTDPAFRTDRGVNLSGVSVTMAVQSNGTLKMTAGAGTPFSAVQVGDEVFIPGGLTGDGATPFNPINEGEWSVIGATSTALTLVRPSSQTFQGYGETVSVSAAGQVLIYSSGGVQVGDTLEISGGFASTAQKSYEVLAVTSKWVEIESSSPLAEQSGVAPGPTGIQFYTSCKRFLRVEADQDCVVRTNGDTGSTQRMSPWEAGDPDQVAEYVKVGPTWSLRVYNRSSVMMNLTVISAE